MEALAELDCSGTTASAIPYLDAADGDKTMTAITNLEDFNALAPFFRIIEDGEGFQS